MRPLTSHYDLVIVGLGAMGTATLEQAARRGLRVLGLEQYSRAHAYGSSHGESRMIRKAYFEHPAYVPLLLRAYELWDDLECRSGRTLRRRTGVLQVGPPQSAVVRGVLQSAATYGLEVQQLDANAIRARFPALRPLADEVGVFEIDGGVLAPELALATQLSLALDLGAEARFGTRVAGWSQAAPDAVVVELGGGEIVTACKLALCNGPWRDARADDAGVPVVVRRKVQVWFEPDRAGFTPDCCPAFLVDRDGTDTLYGFPDFGRGVKAAFHDGGTPTSMERIDRNVYEADVAPVRAALERWMPGAAAGAARAAVCQYDMTPDGHFILGIHPAAARVVVAAGFSGHGFKFAPVIGEIVVDLACDGGTRFDIAFLRPGRT